MTARTPPMNITHFRRILCCRIPETTLNVNPMAPSGRLGAEMACQINICPLEYFRTHKCTAVMIGLHP